MLISARADAYLCTAVPDRPYSQAWNQRCIPYYISNAGTLLDGDARRQLILQSFRVWSSEPCTDMLFMDSGYTDQEPGFDSRRNDNQNIVISIEDNDFARQVFTRRELAITITSFNTATGEIFDADLMINSASFGFDDVQSTVTCKAAIVPPYDLRNTIVHEIGHILGFEHDTDPESTMHASADTCEVKKRDLTADNKLGMCTVYATGQPTNTCVPPASYDAGSGNPDAFRMQCETAAERARCMASCAPADDACRQECTLVMAESGCSCTSTEGEASPLAFAGILLLVFVRRAKRGKAGGAVSGR
jgi:MYXO-CTERM domain-containing protein